MALCPDLVLPSFHGATVPYLLLDNLPFSFENRLMQLIGYAKVKHLIHFLHVSLRLLIFPCIFACISVLVMLFVFRSQRPACRHRAWYVWHPACPFVEHSSSFPHVCTITSPTTCVFHTICNGAFFWIGASGLVTFQRQNSDPRTALHDLAPLLGQLTSGDSSSPE